MGRIADLKPLNLKEEREKFFSSFDYNPQFTYVRSFSPEELVQWGLPQEQLVKHSREMLATYGVDIPNKNDPIDEAFARKRIAELFEKLGLTTFWRVEFHEGMVSRCMIGKGYIAFRSPVTHDRERFESLLNHEVQTHVLRRVNNRLQPWADEPREDVLFRETEEGLAYLHGYLQRSDQVFRSMYLTYLAVHEAQRGSFVDVFNAMMDLGVTEKRAFKIAVHVKRGISDTSQPGGFSKGVVYLEGAVRVWRWLMRSDTDPRTLYWGRIGLDELSGLSRVSKKDDLIYPLFFDDIQVYRKGINRIGEKNEFDRL